MLAYMSCLPRLVPAWQAQHLFLTLRLHAGPCKGCITSHGWSWQVRRRADATMAKGEQATEAAAQIGRYTYQRPHCWLGKAPSAAVQGSGRLLSDTLPPAQRPVLHRCCSSLCSIRLFCSHPCTHAHAAPCLYE